MQASLIKSLVRKTTPVPCSSAPQGKRVAVCPLGRGVKTKWVTMLAQLLTFYKGSTHTLLETETHTVQVCPVRGVWAQVSRSLHVPVTHSGPGGVSLQAKTWQHT
jgi:hypothetical protein